MYPAGEPDLTVQYLTLEQGVRVRVIESGPASDEAVMLVHGWGASVYSFAETVPALAGAGLRVVAIDLPGFGLSDKPTDERFYTTRALSDVVLAAATALGVRRFAFVGHSLGGALGLDLATRGEPRLTRLVLINSVGLGSVPLYPLLKVASPRFVTGIVPPLLTRTVLTVLLHLAFGSKERPTERDVDEYWAPTQFADLVWAARAVVHCASWARVPATRLRSLRIPALVINGARDRLVRGVDRRARLIPNAEVVTFRDAGHLVHQECAAKANELLLRFLGRRREGGARR